MKPRQHPCGCHDYGLLEEDRQKTRTNIWVNLRCAKSRMRRKETTKPIWILTSCRVVDIPDVIIYANFVERSVKQSDDGCVEVKFYPFQLTVVVLKTLPDVTGLAPHAPRPAAHAA